MSNKIFIPTIAAGVIAIVIIFFIFNNYSPGRGSVCFNKFCFEVEIVETQIELSMGLMFRKNLDKNKGMLFVFNKEGNYPFWMKNTLIPLDMIWINENSNVVFISENNLPCEKTICSSINPNQNAKYVLEINAGMAEKIGIKTEDIVIFR